ncbi:MAG: hypothetical protein DRK00_00595 [Thermoprotei archaeon]|nr:MAG: hypothetical protein DRK00_00595 [Thermoprotei archaeon]
MAAMFRKVIGLDLLPGESPLSTSDPRFAYALLVDGMIRERGEARLSEVLEIAKNACVEAIAIDNVYELAPSVEGLRELLSSLSCMPKLVQVTMIGGKTYPLSSLAASLGLGGEKLSPAQAAEVSARLAYMGIGSELLLFERETRIVVSKGRSPAQGGMSLERYRRNVESLVMSKTREIKEALEKRGLDYDLFITRGRFGVERSVFIVYAPRDKLYGVVKPLHGHDIQVRIEPVIKQEPAFAPLSSSWRRRAPPRYLIVGVDPGVSTGVAALSLKGELKLLMSGRELGRGQVARMLTERGIPIIVASDVNPPPLYVRKLAATLNASLLTPPRSLTVEEKRELVNKYLEGLEIPLKVRDAHQRDALAAALYAYRRLSPKFAEVREKIRKLGLDVPEEEVEALVIRGMAIWDAIRAVSRKYYLPVVRRRAVEQRGVAEDRKLYEELYRRVLTLSRRVRELEAHKKELLDKLRMLEDQLQRVLRAQSFEARRDRLVETLQSRLKRALDEGERLRSELEELKDKVRQLGELIQQAATGDVVLAPRVGSVTDLQDVAPPSGIVVVGTLQPSEYEALLEAASKLRPRAIICEQGFDDRYAEMLACRDIALLKSSEVRPLDRVGDVYVYKRGELEEVIKRRLSELEEASEVRLREAFKRILEEYRAERLRKLRLKTG